MWPFSYYKSELSSKVSYESVQVSIISLCHVTKLCGIDIEGQKTKDRENTPGQRESFTTPNYKALVIKDRSIDQLKHRYNHIELPKPVVKNIHCRKYLIFNKYFQRPPFPCSKIERVEGEMVNVLTAILHLISPKMYTSYLVHICEGIYLTPIKVIGI